jgi:hypothetical protein
MQQQMQQMQQLPMGQHAYLGGGQVGGGLVRLRG